MTYQRQQLWLVGLFVGLVLMKLPGVLDGRLWAEDGLFLIDALRLPWWQALITQHTGYIDVTASSAFLIATHLVPLELVGFVSVILALIVQVCPAILIATSSCDWLRQRWMLLLALLLVLAPPVAEEVWLSPVTSQYHLIVCTALILALDFRRNFFPNVILAVASLTGPGPDLLAPLFILRAFVDRSRPRAVQAAIISLGTLIEIAVFCTHPEPNRWLTIDIVLLAHVITTKHLLLPLLGRKLAGMGTPSVVWALAVIPCAIALTLAVIKSRRREAFWLFAATGTTMVMSYLGSLGHKSDLLNVGFGQRYYYAPQVLLGLTLLSLTRTRQIITRVVAGGLVVWLLVVGAWQYLYVISAMADGPSWREQIVMWRDRPTRAIYLWPSSILIDLPK